MAFLVRTFLLAPKKPFQHLQLPLKFGAKFRFRFQDPDELQRVAATDQLKLEPLLRPEALQVNRSDLRAPEEQRRVSKSPLVDDDVDVDARDEAAVGVVQELHCADRS